MAGPLFNTMQDAVTVILSNAGASATGQSYGVPPLRGTGGLPSAIVVQCVGTLGSASYLEGSQNGTDWDKLDSGSGTALASGFQAFSNVPAMIRAITGAGASGVYVYVSFKG